MNAIVVLKSDDNVYHGKINFEQKRTTLRMSFNLVNFEPNKIYAIHIHQYGDITNGCQSLGPHFNPRNKCHSHSEKGHAGDLFNNFLTNSKGEFKYIWETDKLSINGNDISCILGRSVVIHKFEDDLGLKGKIVNNIFKLYKDMSLNELKIIYKTLYHDNEPKLTKNMMLERLERESVTTGNASTRIAYGIIGISK